MRCCCHASISSICSQQCTYLDIHLEAGWQATQQLCAYAQPDQGCHAAVLHSWGEHDPAIKPTHDFMLELLLTQGHTAMYRMPEQHRPSMTAAGKQLLPQRRREQKNISRQAAAAGAAYLTYPAGSSTLMSSSSTTLSCSRLYGCSGSVISRICSNISAASMGSLPSPSCSVAASCNARGCRGAGGRGQHSKVVKEVR